MTFRTLDIGGDKILPYMQSVEEENPALGWRAIRIGLDRPALLRDADPRAAQSGAAGEPLKIMFPMVATCDEFVRAKALVEREKAHLAAPRLSAAGGSQARRDAGGALAAVPDRGDLRRRGLPLRRLQRPDAVPLRHRPREPPGGGPLRPVERADAARPPARRREGVGTRLPADRLRRDRRAAARGHGADRRSASGPCPWRRPRSAP